jgi:uncharacterized protein
VLVFGVHPVVGNHRAEGLLGRDMGPGGGRRALADHERVGGEHVLDGGHRGAFGPRWPVPSRPVPSQNQDLFQFLNSPLAKNGSLRVFPTFFATALTGGPHVATTAKHHCNPATIELAPSPFPAEWVLKGSPQAQATAIAHSRDGAMTVIAWSCTEGRFRWHYQVDEMAHILSGEVLVTDESGTERRLGPGDTVFFPAGSTSVWQVTKAVRKVAVCHVAMPKLVGFGLRAWNRFCRTAAELLGLDAEASAAGGGLVSAEPLSPRQPHSVSAAPPA